MGKLSAHELGTTRTASRRIPAPQSRCKQHTPAILAVNEREARQRRYYCLNRRGGSTHDEEFLDRGTPMTIGLKHRQPVSRLSLDRDSIPYWIAAVLLIVFYVPWLFLNPINGDTGFFAYSGSLMLNGARLYRDIVDPNAPPPYLFAIVCVALGRMVGLAPEPAFLLTFTLLIVFVIYRTSRILSRLFPDRHGAAPLLTVMVTYCLLPYVRDMFGEREHILTCMILPWLFASSSDSEVRSRKGQILDGIMAGIGITMKPYFIAAYGMVQIVNLVSRRRRAQVLRLDNILIAAVVALSTAITVVFFPGYLFIVRMALAYHNFPQTLLQVCLNGTLFLLIAATVLSVTSDSQQPLSNMRNLILAIGWSMALVMMYQREGYGYHYYPSGVMAILALGTLFLDGVRSAGRNTQRYLAYVLITAVVALGIVQGTETRQMPRMTGPLLPIVKREASGKPILVLSTSLWASSPLVNYSGASLAWRFPNMWTLAGLYPEKPAAGNPHPYRSRQEMDVYERYLVDSLDQDVDLHPPQLIIVETGDQKEGFRNGDFDYLDYFLRDPRFAQFFAKYEKLAVIPRYTLYRRR